MGSFKGCYLAAHVHGLLNSSPKKAPIGGYLGLFWGFKPQKSPKKASIRSALMAILLNLSKIMFQ